MSRHVRFTRRTDAPQRRVLVSFLRRDCLWRTDQLLVNPHDPSESMAALPIDPGTGLLIGPTILDMMICDERSGAPATWCLRAPAPLWPASGRADPDQAGQTHPFVPSLISAGAPVEGSAHPDFVLVEKRSTVSIAPDAFRLAIGVHGSVDAAYAAIAGAAAAAWQADLERWLELWNLLRAAGGRLVEDDRVARLRPSTSISREIEQAILRDACVWLGVDPDLDITRPLGRPRADLDPEPGEGVVLRIELVGDQVVGRLRQTYQGWRRGQRLADLTVLELAQLLGALRSDGHAVDADLLEAYLDAAAPDWRDQVTAGLEAPAAGPDDPYEILGVTREDSLDDITAAYRKTMLAVHPDTAGIGAYFARTVAEAYRQIRREKQVT
jgi:DnaJ-domain-containing protein 1